MYSSDESESENKSKAGQVAPHNNKPISKQLSFKLHLAEPNTQKSLVDNTINLMKNQYPDLDVSLKNVEKGEALINVKSFGEYHSDMEYKSDIEFKINEFLDMFENPFKEKKVKSEEE